MVDSCSFFLKKTFFKILWNCIFMSPGNPPLTRLDVGLLEFRLKSVEQILKEAELLQQNAHDLDSFVETLEVWF